MEPIPNTTGIGFLVGQKGVDYWVGVAAGSASTGASKAMNRMHGS